METKSNIHIYSIIAGLFVCSIFPSLIFSVNSFVWPLKSIADFGINGSPVFWGGLFPIFIVFVFWQSGKNISSSLTQTTKYEACSQFTFEVSSKIIIALFTIYIIGLLINGMSVALPSQFLYEILFSLIMILSVSITLIVLTILTSIIIVKQSLKSQY
ncbi:hypothetical protein SAMN05444397_10499 [Flavobacterium aquidurense]|uniref:DUF1648 domain-containing protein n=1 Tax=Flavobacterium frigidimaris TaxID=262320 RepID=A0ABX4BS73_FLAFR|nr:hypothetical protein [Flavobacterium frigidimaris]OXA79620.1 hypothetical protein B0A65_09640 [Flavobacterium frigidimaris]SDZ19256.1 hypothetical protein SAMN05444397_10499 [Flavobacterium aquidurense]